MNQTVQHPNTQNSNQGTPISLIGFRPVSTGSELCIRLKFAWICLTGRPLYCVTGTAGHAHAHVGVRPNASMIFVHHMCERLAADGGGTHLPPPTRAAR